jgi:DNA-binding response OmpR family regulator
MINRQRILVADDDIELLEAVALAFEDLGADVIRARSGDELIERIAEDGPIDLVVTDVSMPWMSGLQAMHSARTAGLDTPVVVMTALADEFVPRQVENLGQGTLLLRKPFAIDELAGAARTLLSRQSSAEGIPAEA